MEEAIRAIGRTRQIVLPMFVNPFFKASFYARPRTENIDKVWSLAQRNGYHQISAGDAFFAIGVRESYPKTFATTDRSFGAIGYVEPRFANQVNQLRSIEAVDKFIDNLRSNPDAEYLIICGDLESNSFKIYRDAVCTLPVFYSAQNNTFRASNEFNFLTQGLDSNVEIDLQGLGEYLLLLESGNKTIFNQIRKLSERATLQFGRSGVTIALPEARKIQTPQDDGKDFNTDFVEMLEKSICAAIEKVEEATGAFEVSGGVDSSAVLGLACNICSISALEGYSMLFPGSYADSQQRKLKLLENKFSATINKVEIVNKYPLSRFAEKDKMGSFYPMHEIYAEALDEMLEKAQVNGVEVIFTGMGGDELFLTDDRENAGFKGEEEKVYRHNLEIPSFLSKEIKEATVDNFDPNTGLPIPLLPHSVLSANETRNNIFIRRGIWPVAPLASVNLFNFCRSLPKKLSDNKLILRRYLQDHGWPEEIYNPNVNEYFSEFFDSNFKTKLAPFLRQLYSQSQLARLGLIDKEKLLQSYDQLIQQDEIDDPMIYYAIAVAEINLQALKIS